MELNAEQIKKALECCPNRSCGVDCPYYDAEICTLEIMRDALALITSQEQRIGAQDMTISELRQRCEKAEHDASRYEQRIKELTEDLHATRTELTQNLHECKADTVRKMQEALCEGRVSNDPVVIAVNVVAKELLESGDV